MNQGIIIVTGGSRGIGRAICLKLSEKGYTIAVVFAKDSEAADTTVDAIRNEGGRAMPFQADVGDAAQVRNLFLTVEARLGKVRGLVANAGILGDVCRVDEQTPEGLQRLLATNVLGPIVRAGEAVRRMSTRHGGKGGAIVMISSVAARLGGLGGLVPYAATKGAIETFTRGLASEVAQEGIRVNAVAPGIVETDMITDKVRAAVPALVPMQRLGAPGEIADVVAWLLSNEASFVTGTVVTASGGR
jgi:NAD(P)-dependent dehydrogenase (short-subunit alcohol dehydrogenase family)